MDKWHQIVINFVLSPGSNGAVDMYLNGRISMQYRGPTAPNGTVLGVSYGIYQNETNKYPAGAKAIPPQVVYYTEPRLYRV